MDSNLFQGKRIRLDSLKKDDASVMARWHRDAEYQRLYDAAPAFPHSESAIAQRIESLKDKKDEFEFAIRLKDSDELIGTVGVNSIDWPHGSAFMAIGIGDRANWGKGYGREAMELILHYGFNELNLHRIQLTVFSYNQRAIALYERLGFRLEGTFRERLLRDGKRHDMHLYGILRHEWQSADR